MGKQTNKKKQLGQIKIEPILSCVVLDEDFKKV